MTLLMVEGFDWTNQAAALALQWTVSGGGVQSFGTSTRFSRGQYATGNNTTSLDRPFTAAATITAGAAVNISAAGVDIMRFLTGLAGTHVASLRLNASRKLEVRTAASGGGSAIGTGTTTIPLATWIYVEMKIHIAGASGTCEVQLNGVSGEIASTTGNFGSTNIGDITLIGSVTGVATVFSDDVYVCDSAGSTNNTFLGDVAVETLYPSADGNYSQYTPNSGGVHFSRVNESATTWPDGDTTYNSDATVGHRDSYVMADLAAASGTVYGVVTKLYARKDDAAVRQVAAFVRQSATDYDGATVTMSASYAPFDEVRETDPNTTLAWTVTGVNNVEVGIKTIA